MPELHVDVLEDLPGWRYRTVKRAVVEEYAEAMERGDVFPPLLAFRAHDGDGDRDGEQYWLVDGRHRLGAARRLGRETVDVDVRDGTLADATLHACGTNAAHGLQRTNDDKRRAVQVMLRDSEWCQWPNREIARRCGVSEGLVRRVLSDLQDALTAYDTQPETEPRPDRDGRDDISPMPTVDVDPAVDLEAEDHDEGAVRPKRLEELQGCWRAADDSERRRFVAWVRDEYPDALGLPAPDPVAAPPIRLRTRSRPAELATSDA